MENKKRIISHVAWLMLMLFPIVIASCDDSNYDPEASFPKGEAFDASKPITVGKIMPSSASQGARVLVYGDNFGNDTTTTNLYIGGEKAVVIRSLGQSLLAIVPAGGYENDDYTGSIRVEHTDIMGNVIASGVSDSVFHYVPKTLSSNFIGETYENNTKYDIKDGPFDDCGGFDRLLWFSFDPLDPDMLYCAGEKKGFRYFDFKNKYVGTLTTSIDNVSSVTFTKEGDMVLSRDQSSDQRTGLYMFTRESGFKTRLELCNGRGVKTVATHPENGRIYYTLYRKGEVWSVDPYNPADNKKEIGLPRTGTGCLMVWHPTGDYCYLIMYERHTIWRSDYNHTTGELSMPYLVVGKDNTRNWTDGVGTSVRISKPWQGFFLKNSEYAGSEDEYDYYFADNGNHCIRRLTPMGRVETYAGHIDNGRKGYYGLRNGDLRTETLFYYPEAIVYDTKRNQMLIGDTNNRIIRRIGSEEKAK